MAERTDSNLYELLKGDASRIYVIAEAGLNHGGSRERALTLVRAAKWAGADAIKFQTFAPDTPGSAKPTAPRKELLKRLELPRDSFKALHKEAQRIGIDFFSTPYDQESADFLNDLGVQAFQIASADITNRPLVEHVGGKGKPVLLSTGTNSVDEIENAINWVRSQSNDQIVLLHGVSPASANPEDLNLKSVEFLRDRFGIPVGFSDQSAGTLGSVVATSLGAQVIERRVMLENRPDTPDQAVSIDGKQLKVHIEELRRIGTLLGRLEAVSNRSVRKAPVRMPIDADMPYAMKPKPVVGKQAVAATASNVSVRPDLLR